MEISVSRRLFTAINCADVGTKPVSASTVDPKMSLPLGLWKSKAFLTMNGPSRVRKIERRREANNVRRENE